MRSRDVRAGSSFNVCMRTSIGKPHLIHSAKRLGWGFADQATSSACQPASHHRRRQNTRPRGIRCCRAFVYDILDRTGGKQSSDLAALGSSVERHGPICQARTVGGPPVGSSFVQRSRYGVPCHRRIDSGRYHRPVGSLARSVDRMHFGPRLLACCALSRRTR